MNSDQQPAETAETDLGAIAYTRRGQGPPVLMVHGSPGGIDSTLVIHGTADVDVTPDHSDHAAATIPAADFLAMEKGTHLSLFVGPEARDGQARVLNHFRSVT